MCLTNEQIDIKISMSEVNCFWKMAEKSGLWERGTYGSPMIEALVNLTVVDSVNDDEGNFLFNVFRLAQ